MKLSQEIEARKREQLVRDIKNAESKIARVAASIHAKSRKRLRSAVAVSLR